LGRHLTKERKRGAQQFRDCYSVFQSIFVPAIKLSRVRRFR
jgi:hypothetical protein